MRYGTISGARHAASGAVASFCHRSALRQYSMVRERILASWGASVATLFTIDAVQGNCEAASVDFACPINSAQSVWESEPSQLSVPLNRPRPGRRGFS